jgi:hypothetical protein
MRARTTNQRVVATRGAGDQVYAERRCGRHEPDDEAAAFAAGDADASFRHPASRRRPPAALAAKTWDVPSAARPPSAEKVFIGSKNSAVSGKGSSQQASFCENVERLWSPALATGGKPWQIARNHKRLQQAEAVAVGCHGLPIGAHGKGALPLRKGGVASLAPQKRQVLRTRRPTGLDAATVTRPSRRRQASGQ